MRAGFASLVFVAARMPVHNDLVINAWSQSGFWTGSSSSVVLECQINIDRNHI